MSLPLGTSAQSASAQSAAEPEVVVLSAFTVDSSADDGYRAANTLAGSRLNTSLTDIASAVNVFTKAFMDDIGATSEDDLMEYSASATLDQGETTGNNQGIGFVTDQFQFRIRGQSASRATNFFSTFISSDTYNIDRFDESRGPNAILFGLGGAGGILNSTTKRASTSRDFGSVEFRFRMPAIGSDQYMRSSIDYNKAVSKKFAYRVNTMVQEDSGWRQNDRDDARRLHLAMTYQINRKYQVRGELEWGDFENNLTRDFMPFDHVTAWLDAGATVDPAFTAPGVQANPDQGIRREGGGVRMVYVGNDQSFRDAGNGPGYNNKRASSLAGDDPDNAVTNPLAERLQNTSSLLDFSIVPYGVSFGGSGSRREMDQITYGVYLEGTPFENFSFELAARHDEKNTVVYDDTVDVFFVSADLNAKTRDGRINPFLGQYFIESDWTRRTIIEEADRFRMSVAYQFDFGELGGRHQLAAAWNRDETTLDRPISVLSLGAVNSPQPELAPNRVRTRTYIADPTNAGSWQVPSWEEVPGTFSVATSATSGEETFSTRWVDWFLGSNPQTEESYMATLQSYWLKNHVVTTVGYRTTTLDGEVFSQDDTVRDPTTNELVMPSTPTTIIDQEGHRLTYGVVARPVSWFSLLYNYSENYRLSVGRQLLLPNNEQMPVAQGKGEDIGFMLEIAPARLFARVAYFTTDTVDDNRGIGVINEVVARNQRIQDAAFISGQITQQERDDRIAAVQGGGFDLFDLASDGWEFELNAKPTSAWTITASITLTDVVESNLAKRTRSTMQTLRPQWVSYDPATDIDGTVGGVTISDELVNFDQWLADETQSEGAPTLGSRDFQARIFTRYSFGAGPLKGAFVGGGYRYSAANLAGIDTDTGTYYYGQDINQVDLLLGYRTGVKLFSGGRQYLTFRLNANNLIQDNNYLTVGYSTRYETINRARLVAPPTYTFSTTLDF